MPCGHASCAARKQQKKNHNCKRICGVTQKKHKTLDQRNLHQNVTKAHRNEIQQSHQASVLRVLSAATMQRQRQNQKSQNGQSRDDKEHSQHDDAKVDSPIHTATGTGKNVAKNVASLQREEEEWSAIADWGHVVVVVPGKRARVVGG